MNIVECDKSGAINLIAERVNIELQKGSVLLLLSGGSNINLAVALINRLDIKNELSVSLIDERYGINGHPDSNLTQLLKAGLKTDGISLIPVLCDLAPDKTAKAYAQKLTELTNSHDSVVGIFGMGSDGHTSGILPGSYAVTSQENVIYYSGPDFERITTTPKAFELINVAFLVAFGSEKFEQLKRLEDNLSVMEQPAQALKIIPDLTVLTDQPIGSAN